MDTNPKPTLEEAIDEAEKQVGTQSKLRVGSVVVLGTASGSFICKVKKLTKKDIVLRRITKAQKGESS